jgi:hypothetical protein
VAALGELFGKDGALQQLFLWGVVNQVISTVIGPALTVLQQEELTAAPVTVLDPATLADLAARGIITVHAGQSESAKSGLNAARWGQLVEAHTVRLSPSDLATAVLRSYLTLGQAEAAAKPQGVPAGMLGTLIALAGDAPGPQQLAEGLRRGLLPRAGKGPDSVSFDQGIAETRLHDKWAPLIADLSAQLLSPADLASAVVRNFMPHAAAVKVAGQSGFSPADFDTLVHLSGDAPGPQQLAEALRRGLIPAAGHGPASTSFAQGIAEGRLSDKWTDVIKGLAQLWPTPVDALDAAVKGQLTDTQGRELYQRLGGDLQFYPWLLASIGESPTPLQAAELAARGIIAEHGLGPDALSYDQAVKESHYRNKWGPAYRALAEHIPPPSTIVTMLAHKSLTSEQAHKLLLQNDMSEDLAAAYIAQAEYEAISDYRGLTQSAVIDMYVAHVINRQQALAILGVLHVSDQAAGLLLDYADLRYVIDSINKSVNRIATLFVGRKIGVQTAKDALSKLQIPAGTIEQIIEDWKLQAAANVKVLTETQVIDAWYYEVIDQAEAINDLGAIGYTEYDAWVLLSNKAKGALPGKPARTVAQPPAAVIAGTT